MYTPDRPKSVCVHLAVRACMARRSVLSVNVDLRLNWIRVLSIAPFGLGGFSCTMAQN